MNKWIEVKVTLPEAQKEAVTNRLFELGAEGVNESDDGVSAFFDASFEKTIAGELAPYLADLAVMYPGMPKSSVVVLAVANENWAERYKEYYKPQKLTHFFYLKPAWEMTAAVPEGMIPIVMEPGQAFGTGLHASTTLSMKLLEHTAKDQPRLDTARIVDVGTGTGILAIAAEKLGFHSIDAIDNDPVAVEAAVKNVALNGCRRIRLTTAETTALKGPYEIIVSNILLETHRVLAGEYGRLLVPGGQLILAGLLAPQKEEITAIMTEQGFSLEVTESLQEWMALTFRKAVFHGLDAPHSGTE